MPKLVILPPIDDLRRDFATRLPSVVPELEVVIAQTDTDVMREIRQADAAFGWVSPEALKQAERLRWLQNPDAGPFVGYYYPELIAHPVIVCNPRGIYSDHVAHHILMFMLALSRGLPYWIDAQRAHRWGLSARKRGYVDIVGSTVLINGVGGIGAETARLCTAMGAQVIGIDPRPEHDCPAEIHPPKALERLLPGADFIITTVPHTPETYLMWNWGLFSLMKPSAYFINIGRGKTASLNDLTRALATGGIAGAGLDVFETEPLPSDHPLWDMENVLITPHVAISDATNIPERRFGILSENARRFVAGETLINVVDKSKWY